MQEKAYLLTNVVSREVYDPANPEHREVLNKFLETGKWIKHFKVTDKEVYNLPYTLLVKTFKHFMEGCQRGNGAVC